LVIAPRVNSPDFSTTFTDGTSVNLYTTLTAGNTVMLDFFFADWPTCQSYAGLIETTYQNHGAGSGNIKYWGISDRDNNAYINTYKSTYGITNPCAGTQGNGNAIIYTTFSSFNFTGFPTYSVICPNKTISFDANWPPTLTGFNSYFTGCGSTDVDFNPATTKFTTVYPNPASVSTTLDFYLDKVSAVAIDVYNVTGQKVFSSTQADVNVGFNYTKLQLDDFANGIYIIKLLQDRKVVDQRMLSVIK
jgi:hypothetical protein